MEYSSLPIFTKKLLIPNKMISRKRQESFLGSDWLPFAPIQGNKFLWENQEHRPNWFHDENKLDIWDLYWALVLIFG